MRYRREIDGLRAVAVIPVILFHAGFTIFSGGYVGVDIFFVISGYLITSIIISELEQGKFSILRFYERRARRILPALFFVMLFCLPFAWMWMLPSQFEDFSQSLVAVSVFASNIQFWRESGYFAATSEEKPLLHTWSLAVEEQYYMLFPIFLILLYRFGRSPVFYSIIAISIISLLLSEWGWRNKPSANFYLVPTRVWELLAGSICAFLQFGKTQKSNNAFSALGLAMIVFALFFYDESTPFPSAYALAPVVGTALIIMYGARGTWVAQLLSLKGFVGIGLISYSAYLWHQPLFAFARIRSLYAPEQWLMLLLAFTSLVLAYFGWRYVEHPFRKRTAPVWQSQRAIFTLSVCGMVFFLVVGFVGHINNGFKHRFEKLLKGDVNHLEFHQYIDEKYVDCEPTRIAEEALDWSGFLRCKQSRKGAADWVILGDSHAEHLFLGLVEANPSKNIVYYIFGGKPYLGNEQFGEIFDVLINSKKPKKILLTMHYVDRLKSPTELFREFGFVVERLKSVGHDVVLIGDIPSYEIHPAQCLYGKSIAQVGSYCSMLKSVFDAQKIIYEESLTRLSNSENIKYFAIDAPLCSHSTCSMILEDTILYRDSGHLNIPGSILVGTYLTNLLTEYRSKNEP